MKALKTLIAIALSAGGLGTAVALGAVSAEHSENKAQVVEASGTEVTLYINHFDGGGTWNNFSYYLFGGTEGENAVFPGVAFTDSMKTKTPNEYDQYQYVLTVDTTEYTTLILVGNPANWGGGQAQTENLVIADMENNGLYCGGQIPSTSKFEVGYYGYTTKTVYLYDIRGNIFNTAHKVHTFATGKNGTTWPGIDMTKVSGTNNIYSAEINSALDNVIFNDGTNDHKTTTISSVADGDAYIVYPDNGYNKSTLPAAEFIDGYMKFETRWTDVQGTGECTSQGWFTSAKTSFEGLSSEVQSKVLEHEPTVARLEAWAEANSASFNPSTGVFSSQRISGVIADDKGVIAIVAVSLTMALTTAGALFLLRRKRKIQ